ncbi:MAG: hypothetical protein JWN34_367 [Bryobacterales bacterium]|nr:hypothetical protein [Bryobacterales bacterium]
MRLLMLAVLMTLAACQPAPVVTDSPAMAEYTPAQQRQMKRDFDALPADSSMRIVVRDCKALRNEIRAGR